MKANRPEQCAFNVVREKRPEQRAFNLVREKRPELRVKGVKRSSGASPHARAKMRQSEGERG